MLGKNQFAKAVGKPITISEENNCRGIYWQLLNVAALNKFYAERDNKLLKYQSQDIAVDQIMRPELKKEHQGISKVEVLSRNIIYLPLLFHLTNAAIYYL